MKTQFFLSSLLLICISGYSQTFYMPSCEHSNHNDPHRATMVTTTDLISAPLANTIAVNQGDTIVGLVTPPIGNQGTLGSCNAWALGYGCGSILAYNVYQDMTWAMRSPAFI